MRSSLAIIIMIAAVCGNLAFAETRDSAEVVVPEGSEYTFDIVMDSEDFGDLYRDRPLYSPSKGLFLLGRVGYRATETKALHYFWVTKDTSGEFDTLGSYIIYPDESMLDYYEKQEDNNTLVEFGHLLHEFYSYSHIDTVFWANGDTTIDSVYKFDSLIVKPIDYDYPPYKVDTTCFDIDYIADSGWTAISIRYETTYNPYVPSFYERIILKDGEVYSQLPD